MGSCSRSVPEKNAGGDNLYGSLICNDAYIHYFWHAYGFNGNKDYWDHGFGWDDPCNTDKPLARTFNACYLLTYSAKDYLNESWDSPNLNWGRRYVRCNIDDLISRCGDGLANARSITGPFVDDRVELYLGFFYDADVPDRAATLLHEARHQGGKPHDATFPIGSSYDDGTGAKEGADSSWDYEGAWMFHALYLWWFFAEGARTTTAMKQRARDRGNYIIDNAFATHPKFSI